VERDGMLAWKKYHIGIPGAGMMTVNKGIFHLVTDDSVGTLSGCSAGIPTPSSQSTSEQNGEVLFSSLDFWVGSWMGLLAREDQLTNKHSIVII
jgi:hypothetical protein